MKRVLGDGIEVLTGAVNIGVVKHQSGTWFVDTGIDNSAVNKAIKATTDHIVGAVITHHHADHMGGCNKLEKLGITHIFAPQGELAFFREPHLEPFSMFGGGFPPKLLRSRHLEARPSKESRPAEDQKVFTVVKSSGHTPDHHSYLYDDILFAGDSVFTETTISKYKLLFAVNPREAAKSAEKQMNERFSAMVPGHGELMEGRGEANEAFKVTAMHYRETEDRIKEIIGERILLKEYVQRCMEQLKVYDIVKGRGMTQYILYQVPLQGYLSNLIDSGEVSIEFENPEPCIIAN